MPIEIDILASLKSNQKKAIKSYTFFALLIILLGLIFIFISLFFINNSETIKIFVGIGGGFISTISAFPIKEIIVRTERFKTYDFISKNIHSMNEIEIKKIEIIIKKFVF